MKTRLATATLILVLVSSALALVAQQTASTDSVVPSMVKFSGTLSSSDGNPLHGHRWSHSPSI